MRKVPGRRPALLAAVAAVTALVATLGVVACSSDRPTVGGEVVTDADLAFYEEELGRGGQVPREEVLDRVAEDRAVVLLAQEAGVVPAGSALRDLLDRREESNAERTRQAEAGQVVYGKLEHDESEFYGRTMAGLRESTLAALRRSGDPRVAVGEDDVRAELDASPEEWAVGATTYTLTSLTVPADVDGVPGDRVLAGVAAGRADLAEVAEDISGAQVATLTSTYDELLGHGFSPDAQVQVTRTPLGGHLDPLPRRGSWVLYRLDEASVDREAAISTYSGRVVGALEEERFEDLVASTAASLDRATG